MTILALNCGSSSLKYAVFTNEEAILRGSVDRIGSDGGIADHKAAVHSVFDLLEQRHIDLPEAVGHRLVHGGPKHLEPALVDDPLLADLDAVVAFAPLHLPIELSAIMAVRERYGVLPQAVCFDTGFHSTLTDEATHFALPSKLFDAGLRRYGFHGLSYEFIAASLPPDKKRHAIFAHLGNGASMVAIRDGRSVDTTMGFTPTGGLVMGTRCGDLDPGVLLYLLHHGYDANSLAHLLDHESGLIGISGTSSDMQALLERRANDPRAALAIDVFCYHARKSIGALAAVLGGVETLVFTGGIGEHAAAIRFEICRGLAHLGIEIDIRRNLSGGSTIGSGACDVRVLTTDEERVIARHTRRMIQLDSALPEW